MEPPGVVRSSLHFNVLSTAKGHFGMKGLLGSLQDLRKKKSLTAFVFLCVHQEIGAFLGEARGREGFFNYLLRLMRNLNDGKDRVWVMSEVGSSRCSVLENTYVTYEEDCWNLLYPFICEKGGYALQCGGDDVCVCVFERGW